MGGYDKIKYWGSRTDPNNSKSRGVAEKQVQWTSQFLTDNDELLDYGPGVGRLSECYKLVKSLSFYDITHKYESRLKKLCEDIEVEIKEFVIDNSGEIKTPFADGQFDTVICSEVLLHVPEDEIVDVMLELARIGKKVVVNTWYLEGEKHQITYCFTRDYKKIIEENNLELLTWEENAFDKQLGFVFKRKL